MTKDIEKDFDCAYLSNKDEFTVFRYGDTVIRFKAPYSLECYTDIKEWDNGYLVVMAKYKHNKDSEEEYIDLIPILQTLYFDAEEFLKPIKRVIISSDLMYEERTRITKSL